MTVADVSIKDLLVSYKALEPNNEAIKLEIANILGYFKSQPVAQIEEPSSTNDLSFDAESVLEEASVSINNEEQQNFTPEFKTTIKLEQEDEKKKVVNSSSNESSISFEALPNIFPIEINYQPQESHPKNIDIQPIKHFPEDRNVNSKLDFEPLISKNRIRDLLVATLSTSSFEGELDIKKVVHQLTKQEVITSFPKQLSTTVRRGVQLLMDASDTFSPYRQDQMYMQSEIRRLFTTEKTTILRFTGTPLRGVIYEKQLASTEYKLPRPGTPIFLLSDFGLGAQGSSSDMATTSEWMDFFNFIKKNHYNFVAFTPYSHERWSDYLKGITNLFHWDRSTFPSEIRKKIGKGHKVVDIL